MYLGQSIVQTLPPYVKGYSLWEQNQRPGLLFPTTETLAPGEHSVLKMTVSGKTDKHKEEERT